MRSNRVAFRVLTNRSLFQSIVACSSGVSYFVFQVKEQLVNSEEAGIIRLWQNAICSGDKRTLESIVLLCEVKGLSRTLWKALIGVMGFAVTHTKDLEFLEWLYNIFPDEHHRRIPGDQREAIGEQGDVEIAKWAMSHEYHISVCGAAKLGHLDLLQYLHEVGSPNFSTYTMDVAAANGHLDVVQFLLETRQEGGTNKAMNGAAKSGHFEVLKYLHENRIESCISTAIKLAAENGRTRCVEYLFEIDSDGFIPREDLVNIAATNGHLGCIRYFHENEYFRFSVKAMHNAAIANHLHIVKFLHENRTEGCQVDTLFECDKRELHRVVEYLFAHRPMESPARAIARAKREDRPLLAAKLERVATTTKMTYLYR